MIPPLSILQIRVVDYLKSHPGDNYVGNIATELQVPFQDVLTAITHLEGKGIYIAEGETNYFMFMKDEREL